MRFTFSLAALAAISLVLSACGGGHNGGTPPANGSMPDGSSGDGSSGDGSTSDTGAPDASCAMGMKIGRAHV